MGTGRAHQGPGSGGVTPAPRPGVKSRSVRGSAMRLAGTIGNRAMGAVVQRQPTAQPTTSGPKRLPITQFAVSKEEIEDAETWMAYVAQRGLTAQPTVPLPDRYAPGLDNLNNAIWGDPDVGRKHPLKEAKEFVKTLRSVHDDVLGKGGDYSAYALAETALKRAEINTTKSEGDLAFAREGAYQIDIGQGLVAIGSKADDELREAKEMGYTIPEELQNLGAAARARYDRASKTWDRGAASTQRLVTPTEESDYVKFRSAALETINSMHAKRAADLARYHAAEAAALEAASEKQMTQLRAAAADRRRALFHQGEKGKLAKLHDAIGEITGAIDEMKGAAKLITKRVDQLNTIAETVTKSGGKLVNLPEIPKSYTGLGDKLKSMNGKLGKVLELMEIAGRGKTQLEDGERYLKGLEMALDHFADKLGKSNPFIAVYVNAYLKPGIDNCVASLNKIAEIESSQNRSILESGDPGALAGMYWGVELGGEDAYLFISQVFKVGAAASINDAAWEYFLDHADDLSAAVGAEMPKDRRTLGSWASKNRYNLWESFYGSVKPPR